MRPEQHMATPRDSSSAMDYPNLQGDLSRAFNSKSLIKTLKAKKLTPDLQPVAARVIESLLSDASSLLKLSKSLLGKRNPEKRRDSPVETIRIKQEKDLDSSVGSINLTIAAGDYQDGGAQNIQVGADKTFNAGTTEVNPIVPVPSVDDSNFVGTEDGFDRNDFEPSDEDYLDALGALNGTRKSCHLCDDNFCYRSKSGLRRHYVHRHLLNPEIISCRSRKTTERGNG